MKEKNKGITLIALVVTIVVLLILAAISLNIVLGNNGIIAKTKDAKEKTEIAEEKEIVSLATIEAKLYDNNGKLTFANFEEAMKNNSRNKKYTLTDEGDDIKITFASGREYYTGGENNESGDETYFIWETSDTEAKIVGLKDEAKQLENIKVPDTYNNLPVTTLNARFAGTKVKNIYIGKNITKILDEAFLTIRDEKSEYLENIKVSKNNQKYADIDGVLVGKDGKYLIQYPFNKSGDEYTIPDSVETIGEASFMYTKVKKINFNNAKYITGMSTFNQSEMAKQTSFTIPKSLDNKEFVYAITVALTDAKKIENITVEDGNDKFKSIDGVLFNNTGTILYYYPISKPGEEYTTPDVTKVINSRAFPYDYYSTSMKNLTFGEGLKEIRSYAFGDNILDCIKMNKNICSIGACAFRGNATLRKIIDIPRNLKEIGNNAFQGQNLDEDTVEKIKKINPKAISYNFDSDAGAWLLPQYDYDMKKKPIENTGFSYEDDTKYDNVEYLPTSGDYVNYKNYEYRNASISMEYSGYGYQNFYPTNGLKWIILNVDEENGKVDLISDRVTKETLKLDKSVGYNNAVYAINSICKALYSNGAYNAVARNINIKDFEKCMNTDGFNERNNYRSSRNVKYGKMRWYSGHIKYPSLYAQQKGNQIGNNSVPDIDLTRSNPDPYDESNVINNGYVSGGWNEIGSDTAFIQTAYRLPITQDYFSKGINLLRSDEKYFISSRCVNDIADTPRFGIRCASDKIDFINIYGDSDSSGYDYTIRL